MGLSSGRVTRQKVCREVHPSISAASKRLTSMPMMPDISRMVVLPNHIRKFISPTSPRVPATEERKRNGSCVTPMDISAAFTGPLSENRVKNSMEKADAMMRLGM